MVDKLIHSTWLWIAWIPILAASVVWLIGGLGRWLPRLIGVLASGVMLVVAVTTLADLPGAADVDAGSWVKYGLFDLRLAFHLDALRGLLLVGVSLFLFLVCVYSVRADENLPRSRRYWAFSLWAGGAAAVVLMADSIWLLLVAWEVVTLMLYLLANYGRPDARKGAFKTLAVLGFADGALLLGIVILLVARTTNGEVPLLQRMVDAPATSPWMVFCYLLFMLAALAKAGAMPLHTWIPAMAEHTPAAVFALLPASLDKLLGIFLLALISLRIFVIGPHLQLLLMIVGSVTVLCAVMMAMIQHDLKRLLSFHAVSQVGYMVLGLGTGNIIGILGGLFHMVNHAIYKSDLFLMAGNVEDETGMADLDRLGGLARRLPVTFASGLVAALAISGIPPLNGFVSKWLVYQGVLDQARTMPGAVVFLIVAVFGSALTLASFVKVLHSVFLGPLPATLRLSGRARSLWRGLPMIVLAILCLGLGIFASVFVSRWMIPALAAFPGIASDARSLQVGHDGLVTAAGWWSPTLGTLLIIVGIVLGLLVYLFTRALKLRVVPTFMGGEVLKPGQQRFAGGDFYETIRRMPGLRRIYGDAESGAFDAYRLAGQAGEHVVDILRAWHSGLLPVYVAWVLFGLLAIVLWLFLA